MYEIYEVYFSVIFWRRCYFMPRISWVFLNFWLQFNGTILCA